MSSLQVNKQRPSTKTGAIPLARRWAFTLRLLIPFPGLGSFSGSYVRSCRRSSAAGLAVQARITGLQFGRNLSPPHRSPRVRAVRFESSNRCPPSLEPPAFKLCARRLRVNISIKSVASCQSYTMSDSRIASRVTSRTMSSSNRVFSLCALSPILFQFFQIFLFL